jgi:hypothetical protein
LIFITAKAALYLHESLERMVRQGVRIPRAHHVSAKAVEVLTIGRYKKLPTSPVLLITIVASKELMCTFKASFAQARSNSPHIRRCAAKTEQRTQIRAADAVREWKFILDDARVVYWSDLPQRLRHRWKEFTGMWHQGAAKRRLQK